MKLLTVVAAMLAASLGISSKAVASQLVFTCSAEGVLVEVERLNNGILRYEAYNIPTTHKRPDLAINGGTVGRNPKGDTLYRFRNGNYLYVAVKPANNVGYGEVLIYRNGQLIGRKYCGDV